MLGIVSLSLKYVVYCLPLAVTYRLPKTIWYNAIHCHECEPEVLRHS